MQRTSSSVVYGTESSMRDPPDTACGDPFEKLISQPSRVRSTKRSSPVRFAIQTIMFLPHLYLLGVHLARGTCRVRSVMGFLAVSRRGRLGRMVRCTVPLFLDMLEGAAGRNGEHSSSVARNFLGRIQWWRIVQRVHRHVNVSISMNISRTPQSVMNERVRLACKFEASSDE